MARTTMSWILTYLREIIKDEDSATWTDDQLQQRLDRHRVYVRRELLQKDVDEQVYLSKFGMLEGDTTTWTGAGDPTDVINLWDSKNADATVITPSGYNLTDGVFTFTSDQGDNYYMDGWSYNIHGAAADIFESLAADPTKAFQWTRGGVSFTTESFLMLAKYHRGLSGPRGTTVVRTYRTES